MRASGHALIASVTVVALLSTSACSSDPEPVASGMAAGPTASQLESAQAFADWTRDLDWSHALDFDFGYSVTGESSLQTKGDVEEVEQLAASYPVSGSAVPSLLREAAKARELAFAAYQDRDFSGGDGHAEDAAAAMSQTQALLVTDLAIVEAACDCRLNEDKPVSSYVSTDSAEIVDWVDGDTVETTEGRVRLIGIDTPEMGDQCSKAEDAKANAEALAPPGTEVTLAHPASVSYTDKYGRLLRYVDVETEDGAAVDVGYSQILSALAVARYDSRDGYDWHPREGAYRDASGTVEGDLLHCLAALAGGSYALGNDHDEDDDGMGLFLATLLSEQITDARASAEDARQSWELHDSVQEQTESGGGSSGGGSGDGGYTGPRCYDPGGVTWHPC